MLLLLYTVFERLRSQHCNAFLKLVIVAFFLIYCLLHDTKVLLAKSVIVKYYSSYVGLSNCETTLRESNTEHSETFESIIS